MRKSFRFLSVLMVLLLCLSPAAMATVHDFPLADSLLSDYVILYEPMQTTDKQLAAVNLFLSNFTEVGVDRIEDWYDDEVLVDFAHDHIWFNDHDEYEYGEYFADNNCRVSDDSIQRIINNYFYDAPQVDLSRTRFDYRNGYYYHCETGGWINCGFAHTTSIVPLGDDFYFVSFMIFGGGNYWDNSVMSASTADIVFEFGEPYFFGCAKIYAEDLSDRSTYKMVRYSKM